MCFAPQRRALFRQLNIQKCSEPDVLWHFLLVNVLRATTACNFLSLLWPATFAPTVLASLPFDPPEPQNTGKTHGFATFWPPGAMLLLSFFLVFHQCDALLLYIIIGHFFRAGLPPHWLSYCPVLISFSERLQSGWGELASLVLLLGFVASGFDFCVIF